MALEMVGVREEMPAAPGREHMVCRPRVTCDVAVGIQRVPADRHERGPLPQSVDVELDR